MSLTKVTSGAITDNSITTAKIEDGTIVNADISASANIAQSKLSLSLPTISSISIENSQGAIPPSDTSLYFDIIGTNFSNPSTVELLDSSTNASTNATTVTYVSATQLRVTASLSAGTYKIRVTRSDGFAGISATALLTVSQAVSWSTSAGSLGTFDESIAISTITLSATSNSAITYAIQSGSLPTGLSLNTSNGEITGTPSAVAADTTSTFTVRATDAESQFADREFNITVTNIIIQQSLRFNDDDSASIDKTFSSAGDRRTFTWSSWNKRSVKSGQESIFLGYTATSQLGFSQITFTTSDRLAFTGSSYLWLESTQVFRDPSAWYHIVVAVDSTNATADDRVKLYVNGTEITSFNTRNNPSLNDEFAINAATTHNIGSRAAFDSSDRLDGYMAEVHFIDGQALTPSSFGETGSNGRWKPKTYSGSYGTNGFHLDFSNSSDFGEDQSGNNNDWTSTNLAATDQVTDNPQNNFATLNPLAFGDNVGTLSEGNLNHTRNGGDSDVVSTMGISSGKFYAEFKAETVLSNRPGVAVYNDYDNGATNYSAVNGSILFVPDGRILVNNSSIGDFGAISTGDIIQVAVDNDNGAIYIGQNGSWLNSGVPTSGSSRTGSVSNFTAGSVTCFMGTRANNDGIASANFGNPSFSISSGNSDENGYGNFEYAPPSGYLALCTNNLPEPTIKDPSEHFNTVLYTGNHPTGQSITGVGFQPDLVWGKNRVRAILHRWFDSSRGVYKNLQSSSSNAEGTITTSLTSFDSDGFTLGSDDSINYNGESHVVWNWKANAGSTSSNTDGSITSTVQANTTAGFSIVTFTGTGANGTFGHGLGAVPKFIIFKNRTDTSNWICYHEALGNTTGVYLNLTNANSGTSSSFFNNTTPTSSVVSVGVMNEGNGSSDNIVAYCFAEIEGYSKFGSYTGNGSTDGTFIYTGFKPAWIMIKRTDSAGNDWIVIDTTRFTFNQISSYLRANTSDAETDQYNIDEDIVSNGFKLRGDSGNINASGGTYIYMAFAEAPFGGILTNEATAR